MTTAAGNLIQDDHDSVILPVGVEAGIISHPDAHVGHSFGMPAAGGLPINLYEQQTLAQQQHQQQPQLVQQPPPVLCQNAMAALAAAGITAGNHMYQQWTGPCPPGNAYGNQEYEL